MILEKQLLRQNEYNSSSFITQRQLIELLDNANEYRDDLLEVFPISTETKIIKVGNAKQLIKSINELDSQCKKIDLESKIKDIYLHKMLEAEKALFEIFSIKDEFIIKKIESDLLIAETRYSAKSDILDYYNLSKFANYCRDKEYEDLVDIIRSYLKKENFNNEVKRNLRIIYVKKDNKFYLRAFTSVGDYKNYGINFSIFVALMALSKYAEENENEIYIDNYSVDDSNLYVSFKLNNQVQIDNNLSLSFCLILENDEVKRGSVSFNGLVELNYTENDKKSGIYLRPKGLKRENDDNAVDLLNYPHRGSVKSVFEKISQLPKLIDIFINQTSNDAKKISSIKHPNDVKDFIAQKIIHSRKEEFKVYKVAIFNKLMKVNVDNTFMLFDLLRDVEDLFEHDDIVSLNFWRNKLYESLIERK